MLISEKIKETFSVREKVMFRSLEIVGRMLRRNPMAEIGIYPIELLNVLAGGDKRDPEGKEYIDYFLNEAVKELKKEGAI